MEQVLKKEKQIQAKPIMKWAGGRTHGFFFENGKEFYTEW